jgi:transposase
VPTPAKMLLGLRGIGPDFASVLWQEGLFRHFDNRRQVAAYAGLAPTPWQSGAVDHEQGVSKSGNPRLRTTMLARGPRPWPRPGRWRRRYRPSRSAGRVGRWVACHGAPSGR